MGLLLLDISRAALLVCEALPDVCHLSQACSRVGRNHLREPPTLLRETPTLFCPH
jgi:hypothetical protein